MAGDEEGHAARVTGLTAGRKTLVTATAGGRDSLSRILLLSTGSEPIVLRPAPLVTLQGEILDEAGLPFAAVSVEAYRGTEKANEYESTLSRTESDNAGRFRFHLPPGRHRLRLAPPGVREKDADRRVIDVAPEDSRPIRLIMGRR